MPPPAVFRISASRLVSDIADRARLPLRSLFPALTLFPYLTLACALAAAAPSPVQADPQAVALIQKVQAASQAAQTLTAEMTYTTQYPGEPAAGAGKKYLLKLMKPNFAVVSGEPSSDTSIPGAKASVPDLVASDGISTWTYLPGAASYQQTPTLPDGRNIHVFDSIVVQAFFDTLDAVRDWIYVDDLNALTSAGTEIIHGVKYRVLKHQMMGTLRGESCPFLQRLYIGPDNLIHRYRLDFKYQGRPGVEMADMANIRLGAVLLPSDFAFNPPPSVLMPPPLR